jgi:hypothetical protein
LGLVALSSTALASGCVEKNAYLELSLTFPPDSGATSSSDARYAVVRVNTSDVPFDEDWQSSDPVPPVRLDPKATSGEPISIEGTPDTETKAIRVKIRFCVDPSCAGIHDDTAPEVRYEIERAFYLGKRTSLALTITCIPNVAMETDTYPTCPTMNDAVTEIPKCSVAGCRDGVTTSYCDGDKHFCEE